MNPDVVSLLSSFGVGTIVGSLSTLLLKHHLVRWSKRQDQQVKTDRATFGERLPSLIATNVFAFIHANRYRPGEREELAAIIQGLADGVHRVQFIDPRVQAAWAHLLDLTVECGNRRLSDEITRQEITEYTRACDAWLAAVKESFGPVIVPEQPLLRRSPGANGLDEVA